MHPDYSVEPLSREIFNELTPLMHDAFGESVSKSYFDWKYLANPAGPAIGYIARHGEGEIAAFYGMIPEIYRYSSLETRIYQSCDTMTHSRHRRKGLFQDLARLTYDKARETDPDFFAYGFGGPTSTPGFLKMGWRIEFEIRHLFHPYPLTLIPIRGERAANARHVGEPDAILDLVGESARNATHTIEKSADFVRWRLSNPQRNYQYLVDGDSAYAIFYRAGDFIFLFDFWERASGLGRNVWAALRHESLRLRSKGVLTFCQDGIRWEKCLKGYGFMRNPLRNGPASDRIPFITYGNCPGGPGKSAWSITPFDHDSF